MFDRFSERARKVLNLARQESERFNLDYIGTEHILLGLVREGSGVAAGVLKQMEVDLDEIRRNVEKLVKATPDAGILGQLEFTPRAKMVLEFALDEARALDRNYVGTEHLLLGLLREKRESLAAQVLEKRDGLAAQVLIDLGVKLEDVRQGVKEFLAIQPDSLINRSRPPELAHVSYRSLSLALFAEPELLMAMGDAEDLANEFKHDRISGEHLFLGLLKDDNGFTAEVLTHFGLKLEDVRDEIVRRIKAR